MRDKLPSTTRSMPISLIRAREQMMIPIREMLSASGITEQQWRVLRVLSEFGPQNPTDVARRACLLLPSLTRITRTMIDKGLVERSATQGDRRRQTLNITDAGQALLDENMDQAMDIVRMVKARFGAERYEELLDLLTEFTDSFG